MRRVVLLTSMLCCCGTTSSVVLAQATVSPAPTQADDKVAHGLFDAGKSAYEAGNFKEALQFFEQAYQHSPRPAFLFNIGQVADRLRQDDKAITSFKAYLDQVPSAENRAEVEQRVTALEDAKRQREAGAAAAPVGTAAAVPSPATVAAQADTSAAGNDQALTSGAQAQPADAASSKPITKQWWFWTGLGAVVVGGTAVALAVALGGGGGGQAPLFQGSAGALRAP